MSLRFPRWSTPKNSRAARRPRLFRIQPLEERLAPAAGQLDSSFATGGVATTRFPNIPSAESANAVTVDSQGRTVIAGYVNNGATNDFVVARYLATGGLDLAFGTNGVVTGFFGATDDIGNGVAVDSMDRVIVAGYTVVGSKSQFGVARLTSSGVLDTTFSGDGLTTIAFGSGAAFVGGVAVDALNRVVVSGGQIVSGQFDLAVARLTSTGNLDTTFDGDGLLMVDFNGGDDFGNGVAIDTFNRPVLAVSAAFVPNAGIAVVRLTETGGLDNSFDGDGKQQITFAAGNESAFGIAIDSMSRPIVVGYADPSGLKREFAVARLTTAGALDNTFDGDGKQTVGFTTAVQPRAIAVDSMDRPVVVGNIVNGGNNDYAVARLTSAGILDSTFDSDGRQIITFSPGADMVQAVAIASGDRVMVAGRARPVFTDDIAVARLTAGGVLDSTFDGDGLQTTGLNNQLPFSAAQATTVDSLGRIVVAGFMINTENSDFAVTRYLSNGTLDTSFGTNGFVLIDFGGTQDYANSVAIDSQNRVVVAGYTQNGATFEFAVARLTTAGQPDVTFDGDGKNVISVGPSNDYAYGVDVDSNDRVILAGSSFTGLVNNFAVVCLTTTGGLDNSFDGDGTRVFAFGSGDEYARGVAVDSLNRIVVAGYAFNGVNNDFAVARLLGTGAFDSSFDGDGLQTIDFGGTDDFGRGVAIDSLNRAVVVGDNGTVAGSVMTVARLTTAGALDSTFDGDGRQVVDVAGTFDNAAGVAIDSANRVIIGGDTLIGTKTDFAVSRLTAAGALDSTFDSDGKQTQFFGTNNVIAGGVAVDQYGRPIVAGTYAPDGINTFATVRWTSPTQVTSVDVDNNSGQRSMVRSLKVNFDNPVTFVGAPVNAFQLVNNNTMTAVTLNAVADPQGRYVTLTFSGPSTDAGTFSLSDGRYNLTVLANQITIPVNGFDSGGPGGNYVEMGSPTSANKLFRLFGDADGNGSVSAADFNAFRIAYGTTGPSIFDFAGDNNVSAADFNNFRTRYGVTI